MEGEREEDSREYDCDLEEGLDYGGEGVGGCQISFVVFVVIVVAFVVDIVVAVIAVVIFIVVVV